MRLLLFILLGVAVPAAVAQVAPAGGDGVEAEARLLHVHARGYQEEGQRGGSDAVKEWLAGWRRRALLGTVRASHPHRDALGARRGRRGQECQPASKLWHAPGRPGMQGSMFLFGSYHHHYAEAWPYLPDNNILALSSCHTLRTEIDLGDASVVEAFDECTVLPGNSFNHIYGWPVHTTGGESLLDRVDAETAVKMRAYMVALIERFRALGRETMSHLTHGWEALKPMAWMMKYSELAYYNSTEALLAAQTASSQHVVLDEFLFLRARELGMATGGIEDGTYMCLLFDTIETVPEASAYISVFLDALENGVVASATDDDLQELMVEDENVERQLGVTEMYNCAQLCEFEAWWNAGIQRGYETLGRDLRERQHLQAVQRRQIEALGQFRNRNFAAYLHLATLVEPDLRHCFVLGLGHLMDHNATCSGNDVPQLLNNEHGLQARYIPADENICDTILRPVFDQAGADTDIDGITMALVATVNGTGLQDPWLQDGSSTHDIASVCSLPAHVSLTIPGPVCSVDNFTCSWNELSPAEETAAAWPDGDTHNADTEPHIVGVEQFWPLAEPVASSPVEPEPEPEAEPDPEPRVWPQLPINGTHPRIRPHHDRTPPQPQPPPSPAAVAAAVGSRGKTSTPPAPGPVGTDSASQGVRLADDSRWYMYAGAAAGLYTGHFTGIW